MRIGDGESADAAAKLSETKAPIEGSRAVIEVSGVDRKVETRPQANIGIRFKLNIGRLHRGLQFVIIGPRHSGHTAQAQKYPSQHSVIPLWCDRI